jgi:hypothetical protein
MNNFENLKSMSVEELAEWLDVNGMFDGSLWNQWFDERYCSQCESIEAHYEESGRVCKCAYCEVYEKCRFFVDWEDVPNNKAVIKMWLESEVKE